LHVPIGILKEPQDNVFHVFADVTSFGQRGSIHDGERNVENPGKRLSQESFTGTGGADQQNVALRELHFGAPLLVHLDALVVVINGHREFLFGGFLSDDVLIQILLQLQWFGKLVGSAVRLIVTIVFKDRIADRDAFIANISTRVVAWRRDELSNNVLAFVAKGTTERVVRTSTLHTGSPGLRNKMRS
jgi:hypothetical protein